MDTGTTDRRTVIAGGATAVAGLAAWMTLGRGAATVMGDDGIRIVRGALPGWTTVAHADEHASLDALVGQNVQLRGPGGMAAATVDRIETFAIANAPAGVRTTGFAVHFTTDPAIAPVQDGTVALARPILGLDALFVTRGNDKAGRASLLAVIA